MPWGVHRTSLCPKSSAIGADMSMTDELEKMPYLQLAGSSRWAQSAAFWIQWRGRRIGTTGTKFDEIFVLCEHQPGWSLHYLVDHEQVDHQQRKHDFPYRRLSIYRSASAISESTTARSKPGRLSVTRLFTRPLFFAFAKFWFVPKKSIKINYYRL